MNVILFYSIIIIIISAAIDWIDSIEIHGECAKGKNQIKILRAICRFIGFGNE